MKTNFSAKNAKVFRSESTKEGKGMNYAIKAVVAVFERENTNGELLESIKSAKADGIGVESFSASFILENLNGTKWVSENGKTILENKKGQMVAKVTWTAGQVVDYVRRANRARLEKVAKENK